MFVGRSSQSKGQGFHGEYPSAYPACLGSTRQHFSFHLPGVQEDCVDMHQPQVEVLGDGGV